MNGKVNYRILVSLILFGFLFLPPILRSEVTIPDSGAFVIDMAGIIDVNEKQQLEGWLRELEQKTTAQVKILTVQTIEGEDFFGFVQRHADAWKLGQKGKDNGALICLSLKGTSHPYPYWIWVGSCHSRFLGRFTLARCCFSIFQTKPILPRATPISYCHGQQGSRCRKRSTYRNSTISISFKPSNWTRGFSRCGIHPSIHPSGHSLFYPTQTAILL